MRANSAVHLPNYTADSSVLNMLEHFTSIDKDWCHSPSFLLTAFKLTMAFTYNKYLKNGMQDPRTLAVITSLFKNAHFQNLLHIIPTKEIDIKHRLFLYYIKILPAKMGYILGIYITKIFKNKIMLS
jgi:hypothetical protein